MAKKMATAPAQPQSVNSTDINKGKKRATASEIDDIFAAKKPKVATSGASSSLSAGTDQKQSSQATKDGSVALAASKKSRKKAKTIPQSSAQITRDEQAVKWQPETVIDSSTTVVTFQDPLAQPQGDTGGPAQLDDEDLRFIDSRGNTRRKTEDGLPIYTVEELKIGQGGAIRFSDNTPSLSRADTAPHDRRRGLRSSSPTAGGSALAKARALPKNVVLTEAGRSAWYDKDGQPRPAYVIGIAGGSASGKTRVATEIIKSLNVPWVTVISQDNFYKSLTPSELQAAFRNEHDFDKPQSCDYDLMLIILEGLFVLHDKAIRDELDLRVFVQCDSDLMLARRLRRDIIERGRTAEGVLDQYLRFVKPSFDNFIQPTSRYADILVPGEKNDRSIDLITGHIRRQLDERKSELRVELYKDVETDTADEIGLPPTVHILEQGPQLRGCMTILRCQDTPLSDFVFFADRISRRVVSHALTLLPSRDIPIMTGTGIETIGQEMDIAAGHLCGVSILRSGASLEKGLRRVVRDIPLGSMLIQSDAESGEPLLYQINLPQVVTASREGAKKSWIMLLDSQIGTGAAALMAVRVLLDHGVPQEQIIICTILVSKVGGVWALHAAFPKVRIVSSAADDGLEERWEQTDDGRRKKASCEPAKRIRVFAIQPGLGSFGGRYFGTGV
ncbi:Uridine kinase [Microbotryomycetes sp. JL201]|nr:Uridine kinase [Microbotryomycetes sp. JL201]